MIPKLVKLKKKVSDHNHDKYITTPEFNNLAARVFTARLAQASLVTKTYFDVKLKDISDRVTSNKTKHLLDENEFKKLKTFDVAYFRGKNYFGNNSKNYLIFDTASSILTNILGIPNNYILEWESIGVSEEVIKLPKSNKNVLSPLLDRDKSRVKFNEDCLIQDQNTYTPQTIVNIYIVYDITKKNPVAVIQHLKTVSLVLLN